MNEMTDDEVWLAYIFLHLIIDIMKFDIYHISNY